MPPIKHTQLFDFPAYLQAIKDVKNETTGFAKTVGDVVKRLQTDQKGLVAGLAEYRDILKSFNVTKGGAADGLKGLNTGINETIARMTDLKALQSGLASVVEVNAASVRELKAEYSGLKKQYEALRPTQADYAQQVENIKSRIKEVTPSITAYSNAIKVSKMSVDAAEGSYRRMQQELTQLKNELKVLPGAFDLVTGKLNKANPEAVKLTERIGQLDTALKTADSHMGVFGRNVGNYKSAFDGLGMSFTQVARELPSLAISMQQFILAISNNLPMVQDEIKKARQEIAALRAEGKETPSLFKRIASSMFSWQVALSIAITLLTVFGKQIGDWVSALFKGKEALDAFKKSNELLNKALDSTEYKNAVQNVNELRINIDLAKQGLISKDGVLKQYNESIGKTTGQVKSLDEAEQALTRNGEAYVKMMLFKAAANLALEDAAKKALEAEKIRLKKLEEFTSVKDQPTGKGAFVMPGSGSFNAAAFDQQKADQKKFAEQRKQDAITQEEDAQKVLEDIAKKFQTDAAKISSKYKFDFFSSLTSKADKDKEKKYQDFVRAQQALLEKGADLDIKQNELKLTRKEISEKTFEERKLAITEDFVKRAIILEQSLGQKADKSRIEDYKGRLTAQQIEYEKFLQKQDERMNAGVRVTPVGLQTEKTPKTAAGEKALETALEGRAKAAQKAIDAENLAYEDGRDKSYKDEIAHLERIKAIQILYGQDTANTVLDIKKKQAEKERQLRQETEQFIYDAISTGLQILQETSNANIQNRIDNLEQEKQRELQLAGNNAAAREAIEKQYNQRIAKEKRKQAQQDKNFALFNVAINTAAGVVKSIAQWGMPLAIPFIALAVGTGLLQAAAIASKPLPQFRRGTRNAPKGLALTGEEGFEFIQKRSGELYRSGDGPTLTALEGGEKIFTHDESKRMLERSIKAQEAKQLTETAMLHGALAAQIRKGKQLESIHIMSEALQRGGVSKEQMREIMKEAMAAIVIERNIWDERGYRKQQQETNMRITELNNRYSF
jgi:hypothetical protein